MRQRGLRPGVLRAVCAVSALFLSCAVPAGQAAAQEDALELSFYVGERLSDAAAGFDGMTEPSWIMGITYSGNGQVTFGSAKPEGEDPVVTQISLRDSGSYTLCGLDTGMSREDAVWALADQGFRQTGQEIFYRQEEGWFVSLAQEESGLAVTLNAVTPGPHTDREDVFPYMGCMASEILEQVEGLSMWTEDGLLFLGDGGVVFEGELDRGDPEMSRIRRITVSGRESSYCLYGLAPGDSWDEALALGFGEGGSGELIDAAGNTLVMVYSEDEQDPRIILQKF